MQKLKFVQPGSIKIKERGVLPQLKQSGWFKLWVDRCWLVRGNAEAGPKIMI